jgi:hypothetical protein
MKCPVICALFTCFCTVEGPVLRSRGSFMIPSAVGIYCLSFLDAAVIISIWGADGAVRTNSRHYEGCSICHLYSTEKTHEQKTPENQWRSSTFTSSEHKYYLSLYACTHGPEQINFSRFPTKMWQLLDPEKSRYQRICRGGSVLRKKSFAEFALRMHNVPVRSLK